MGLFLDGLRGTVAAAATILALIAGLLAWGLFPTVKVPLWLVVSAACMAALMFTALVSALRTATAMISFGSTKVIAVKNAHVPYEYCICLCVIEPVEPLRIGTTLSFHWDDERYERPLGFGTVVHEQDDGRIVVGLTSVHADEQVESFVKKLKANDKGAVESLRARAVVAIPYAQKKGEDPDANVSAKPLHARQPAAPLLEAPDKSKEGK